ncbi:MAG: YbaB/EbfC family nucleoid-associated protein [Chlamydiia bacterium]
MGSGFLKKKRERNVLQQQMQAAQMQMLSRMETIQVTGTAGQGLVTVVLKGNGRVTEVRIAPEVVRPDDIEGLQDLILMAVNDASAKLEAETEAMAAPLTMGMG